MKPSARANKPFGYKAVIVRKNGSTYQPVRHNFKTRIEAINYATRWIEANNRKPEILL